MTNRGFLAVMAAIGFIALLSFGLLAKSGPDIEIGQTAPDAAVDRLGEDGQASLSDHRGKWVLLNFWASWCAPCRDEAPTIERFARQHSENLVVVGMNSQDLTPDAEKFARDYHLTYELLHDGEGARMKAYNVKGLPESFLIDPEGKIAYIYRGPVSEEILANDFAPLIDGGGSR